MKNTILVAKGSQFFEMPIKKWKDELASAPQHIQTRLSFMTKDHHRVRYFVVKELPRFGQPIPPAAIARELSLPMNRVVSILDELEKNLFFLVRNDQGAVEWAFPVTAARTTHHLTYSTGERLDAA